jgi:general secretion pathway protein K
MMRRLQVRGSVMVIVLVTLLFTSFALILFVEQASTDLLVDSREAIARRLRRDAYSTLESVLATLEDFRRADGGLHGSSEGWGDPLGFSHWAPREGCTAEVSVVDESGKISLSQADAATFTNLFKHWDLKQADADRLTDALMGWMKRDYVPASASSPDYDQGDTPFEAPARPLRSYSELAAIDYVRDFFYDEAGRPNEYWRRFASAFSLYRYARVNLNAANQDVLAALGLSEDAQYNRLADFLGGKGGYSSQGPQWLTSTAQAAGVIGAVMPPNVGFDATALRVNVTIREGRNEFRLSAVVAPSGGATVVKPAAMPSFA